ncbi:MAG TPA: EAL domain-containing protein [Gammaproteobacteria bacterium]
MTEPVRILILEDNPLDAELVVRQLHHGELHAAHRVVATERDFRFAIADFAPHVIISDFSLPGFDGLAALQIAAAATPGTPFIFVSGTIGEERAIDALKRGAADYVLKDNLNRLVPAIRGALREAEIVRARDLAEEMLRAREARLRDIINTSRAWIWECDEDGRYTFSSPSVEHVLGYGQHEVLGHPLASFCHPSDADSFAGLWDDLKHGRTELAQATLRCVANGGETRWIDRDVVVVRDDAGRFRGLRGADRDVTDRVRQELRIHRLNRALTFLSEANTAMLRLRAREELLEEACRIAVQRGGYAAATIYLRPAEGDAPVIRRAVNEQRTRALPKEPLDGDGPVARALRTGRPVVIEDHEAARPSPASEPLRSLGLRASAALPLLLDKTPVGVLHLHAVEPHVFEEAELDLLTQVAGNIAFALQYLQSKDTARFLQYFDPVTALPKRKLYLRRLGRAIATGERRPLAVLVLDIKNLSVVNDSLGRAAGDLALQLVAERLKGFFGNAQALAHLGGGTYAAVQAELADGNEAVDALIARVLALFQDPFDLLEQEVRLSIRAGVAIYPHDGEDANALLNGAETALARAKDSRQDFLRHTADMNAEAARRLSLTNRLRRAVAERSFSLHYQPKVSLATGHVEGVEALLRWRDPERGFIRPDSFVPMLEAEGLIDDVGRWVIEQALEETAGWSTADGEPLAVAVNVSPLQLRRRDFASNVLDILAACNRRRSSLEIEITESMLMENIDDTIALLVKLRERGVSIQIDDFGTGYSSLSVLSRLPVDCLKIDRSFVNQLRDGVQGRSVVQTTISLAESLGLRTVAEGVETEQQLRTLCELGCTSVQGHLVCPPLPAGDLARWLGSLDGRMPADLLRICESVRHGVPDGEAPP